MSKKKNLRKMFPDWASPEVIIEKLREEYSGDLSESDIYRNAHGDAVIVLDMEVIGIFQDYERPGLYCVCRNRTFEETTKYSDANSGLTGFQEI